jgi:hypothetical protein
MLLISIFCKKYMVHGLFCKMEGDTVNVPYKKQKTNFRAIYINK